MPPGTSNLQCRQFLRPEPLVLRWSLILRRVQTLSFSSFLFRVRCNEALSARLLSVDDICCPCDGPFQLGITYVTAPEQD